MKRIIAAVAAAAALAGGGYLAGHTTRPTETDPATTITAHCQELQRPNDPNGVIGSNWPSMSTCDKLASSARFHSAADIALRSAAEDIRSAQQDIIDAAHPNAEPAEARLTIRGIRSDLAAALSRHAVVAVGTPPVDYTQTR